MIDLRAHRRWRICRHDDRYVCFGPRTSNGAEGATAEIAFVKWLLWWGNKAERLEFAEKLEKYRGDLWNQEIL